MLTHCVKVWTGTTWVYMLGLQPALMPPTSRNEQPLGWKVCFCGIPAEFVFNLLPHHYVLDDGDGDGGDGGPFASKPRIDSPPCNRRLTIANNWNLFE